MPTHLLRKCGMTLIFNSLRSCGMMFYFLPVILERSESGVKNLGQNRAQGQRAKGEKTAHSSKTDSSLRSE